MNKLLMLCAFALCSLSLLTPAIACPGHGDGEAQACGCGHGKKEGHAKKHAHKHHKKHAHKHHAHRHHKKHAHGDKKLSCDHSKKAAKHAFAKDAPKSVKLKTVAIVVDGWCCGDCADRTIAKLGKLDGVYAAKANVASKQVQVRFDAKKTGEKKIRAAITSLGFKTHAKATKKGKKA